MNTVPDLQAELAALAEHAPSDGDVRGALSERISRQARRRRTTALIAAAAAVVVVAGGASVAGAMLSHRSAGPAAPTPVVSVPDVPLPPHTKLIRHQLHTVTTPVTAVPPKGLTGQAWLSAPGRLAVSYFDPAATGNDPAFGWTAYSPQSGEGSNAGPVTAGYTITDQRDEKLQSVGPDGPTAVTVTRKQITVGGHAATLDTAPSDTDDQFGFPANRRISWQLADGRWIHVWASGPPGWFVPGALEAFAAGITEQPQTLNRTIGIGLTLPALTVDSSMNSSPAAGYFAASLGLCPPGVDPMAPQSGSSSGSGSASIGPDGVTTESQTESQTETSTDPSSRCITAVVATVPLQQLNSTPATTVTVGDTVAHVDAGQGRALADLGHGLTALVSAPAAADLSAADLAALVASVRLSPAVTVLPPQVFHGPAAASSMAATAIPIPSPSTAATDRPTQQSGGSVGAATAPPSAAIPPGMQTAMAAITQPAEGSGTAAAQLKVVTGYLDAVKARDCAAADRHWIDGKPQIGNGDLCHAGSLRLLGYRIDGAPATPSPTEAVVATTITIAGGDESMPDGDLTWFFSLQRQPSGDWLITGGGTGP